MYKALSAGVIGVRPANLDESIADAKIGGFEGLEVGAEEIRSLVASIGAEAVKQKFADAGLKVAGFGLPTAWRGSEADWKADLEKLPALAEACSAIGAVRSFTWILPSSDERTLEENRQFHIDRLRPATEILGQYGISFGMEFVGPKTSRKGQYPFYYKMEDMLALAKEIGPNVGLLVDSWHLYTSGGKAADIQKLEAKDVVYVHVNDAPAGVSVDEQIDNVRCLPGETGVIEIGPFLASLKMIGYDGPIVAEPFNKHLTDLSSDEERLRVVGESMDRIMALI